MQVLVVDDSEMVRNVLSAMVRKLGHTVVVAGSAAEALAHGLCIQPRANQGRPDQPQHTPHPELAHRCAQRA